MRLGAGPFTNIDWLYEIRNGRAFVGAGTQAAGVGLFPHVQLLNPAASGKTIIIRRVIAFSATAQRIALASHNTALTALAVNGRNLALGGTGGVGEVRTENNAGGLGTALENRRAIANEDNKLLDDWWAMLDAGEGMLIRGTTSNTDFDAAYQWVEF